MACPDTIILLIVDYHAAIARAKTSVPLSLVCAPEDDDDDDDDDGQR